MNSVRDNVWADSLGGLDVSLYTKDTPKEYMEKEKPKIDPKVI